MRPVFAFVNQLQAVPYSLGGFAGTDCVLCLADWVQTQCGFDFADRVRLQYDSAPSLQRLTGWYTDPLAAMEFTIQGRLARTATPAVGDIALVQSLSGGAPSVAAALCLGEFWAMKLETGAILTERIGKVFAAWEVGCAA